MQTSKEYAHAITLRSGKQLPTQESPNQSTEDSEEQDGGGGFGPNEDSAEKATEETVLDQLTRAQKPKETSSFPHLTSPHSHFLVNSRRS